ncbi:hypothetical protein FOL47_009243 [Perkinsus chesapeaki]|uniref:EF-hand domain-containing protein n=1 Tax=Perkinsus chesapeaki TaxID=330153 RepID=A0A7J6MS73_PERCH|nr:hypothetical protein FOL47_009243 [Perkinsus chesapeaki]
MRFAEDTVNNEDKPHSKLGKKKSLAGKGLTASLLKMEKLRNIMQIFKKYVYNRTNGSDYVSRDEGLLALKDLGLLGLSTSEVDSIFNKSAAITNPNNDKLSIQMFIPFAGINIVLNKTHWPSIDDLPDDLHKIQDGLMEVVLTFREIDVDDSGEIDASELKTALCSTTDNELADTRFAEMDVDSDKTVSVSEFVRAFLIWSGSFDDQDDDNDDQDDE